MPVIITYVTWIETKRHMKEGEKSQRTIRERDGEVAQCSTRKSEEYNLGELKCSKFDKTENLHAVGSKHAAKQKADGSHVKVTGTWTEMACVLADEYLLLKLSFGDITSNELFYLLLFTTCITQKQIMLASINKGNARNGLKRICLAKLLTIIFDALRDLVRFVQFKKRERHPWRNATFSKVEDFSLQKK